MRCVQQFLLKECFAFYKTFRPNVEAFSQLFNIVELPVSSVGRVPDYRAGGRGFKHRPDQHSGSLNN